MNTKLYLTTLLISVLGACAGSGDTGEPIQEEVPASPAPSPSPSPAPAVGPGGVFYGMPTGPGVGAWPMLILVAEDSVGSRVWGFTQDTPLYFPWTDWGQLTGFLGKQAVGNPAFSENGGDFAGAVDLEGTASTGTPVTIPGSKALDENGALRFRGPKVRPDGPDTWVVQVQPQRDAAFTVRTEAGRYQADTPTCPVYPDSAPCFRDAELTVLPDGTITGILRRARDPENFSTGVFTCEFSGTQTAANGYARLTVTFGDCTEYGAAGTTPGIAFAPYPVGSWTVPDDSFLYLGIELNGVPYARGLRTNQ